MVIQEYPIIEQAVYQGVALAISKLSNDKETTSESVVDTIVYHVMTELCDIIDFGSQAIKFSPGLMKKIWELSTAQSQQDQPKQS